VSENIEQRSSDWFAARCGSLGASQIADALAKSKDGKTPGSTSVNLRAKLVVERLTGVQEDGFKSAAMIHGINNEANARTAYEAYTGQFVTEVGLYRHPYLEGTHASPDGLVDLEGLVEIKCPTSATHIETLKTGKIPTKYIYQMQWQMACADRQWCDFVSFDNRLKGSKMLFIKRVHRDDELIAKLECEVAAFLAMVQADMDKLNEMYPEDT
jgi:putative phage-type endonuclease